MRQILILLLIVSTRPLAAQANRWMDISTFKSGPTHLQMDTTGLRVLPEGVSAWFHVERKNDHEIAGMQYEYFEARIVAACARGEYADVGTVYYDSAGNRVSGYDVDRKDWKFTAPPPDTYGEGEMQFACQYARLTHRLR